jgi:hypothetical protein
MSDPITITAEQAEALPVFVVDGEGGWPVDEQIIPVPPAVWVDADKPCPNGACNQGHDMTVNEGVDACRDCFGTGRTVTELWEKGRFSGRLGWFTIEVRDWPPAGPGQFAINATKVEE